MSERRPPPPFPVPLTILNAWAQLKSAPSPLPQVTKGIEVPEGCYGRLLHTAVAAPWKWSYAPCQLGFVFPTPPALLSLFKTLHRCSLAELREGIKGCAGGQSLSSQGRHRAEPSDWLIRYSLSASLFREGWDPLTFNPAEPPPIADPSPPLTLNHKSAPPPPFPPL